MDDSWLSSLQDCSKHDLEMIQNQQRKPRRGSNKSPEIAVNPDESGSLRESYDELACLAGG
jgi:hypothetical protein